MEKQDYSRRLFIHKFLSVAGLATVAGGTLLIGCNSETKKDAKSTADSAAKPPAPAASANEEMTCGDYSNVSKEELDKRKKLGYEEIASDPERHCIDCNLFIPKGEGKECGGCILFKGPVNNEGSCTYWAEQVS
jgi:hypothetical protein